MENDKNIELLHRAIEDLEAQLAQLRQMVGNLGPVDESRAVRQKAAEVGSTGGSHTDSIVEGVFDGQNMVGPDGKIYTVPANYASKSKLVEGDIMKLTIKHDGSFIYKQIGPVSRNRVIGTLVRTDSGSYRALTKGGRSYRLLTASVTYYKGEPGDSIVLLIPQEMDSKWAAVENIVRGGASVEELGMGDEMELPGGYSELPAGDEMELPSGDRDVADQDE